MPNTVYIGWDSREDIAYEVARHSILEHNTIIDVKPLKLHEMKDRMLVTRPDDPKASTQFTFTRFLAPYLNNYRGWALFVDCDFLFLDDVQKLFDLADHRYAVQVVKHDYSVNDGGIKMDGQVQHAYPRKNWSSCILFNCGHPKNQALQPELLNTYEMSFLHQFKWLDDTDIGDLPHNWNWLVGHYDTKTHGHPQAVHYTLGTPFMEGYEQCDFAPEWFGARKRYYDNW